MFPVAGALELLLQGTCEVRGGSVCRSDRLFGLPNIVPVVKFGSTTLSALFAPLSALEQARVPAPAVVHQVETGRK